MTDLEKYRDNIRKRLKLDLDLCIFKENKAIDNFDRGNIVIFKPDVYIFDLIYCLKDIGYYTSSDVFEFNIQMSIYENPEIPFIVVIKDKKFVAKLTYEEIRLIVKNHLNIETNDIPNYVSRYNICEFELEYVKWNPLETK